jgi:hypothetical protein
LIQALDSINDHIGEERFFGVDEFG